MRRYMMVAALMLPLALASEAPNIEEEVAQLPPLKVVIEESVPEPQFTRLEDLVFATMGNMQSNLDAEARCLAQAVYFEARSEDLEGQLAVAQVVLNRVSDRRYPASICNVVFQNDHLPFRCQFSFACDGRSDRPHNMQAWAIARTIAHIALAQKWNDVTQASTHYHAVDVRPYWMNRLDRRVQVGRHIFYRDKSF